MGSVYTLAQWRAKPGHEEQFVTAWRGLADRTRALFPDATAVLLRDREDPSLFVSFGPWESVEVVAEWRNSPAFVESGAQMREHLDGLEPHTMDVRVVVD
jgi:heme-degrading monooxygenase HmoA